MKDESSGIELPDDDANLSSDLDDLFDESDLDDVFDQDFALDDDFERLLEEIDRPMHKPQKQIGKLFATSLVALLVGAVTTAASGYVYVVKPERQQHEDRIDGLTRDFTTNSDATTQLLENTISQLDTAQQNEKRFEETLTATIAERKALLAAIGISAKNDSSLAEQLRDDLHKQAPDLPENKRTYTDVIEHMKQAHREQLDEIHRSVDHLSDTAESTIKETRASNESLSAQIKKVSELRDQQMGLIDQMDDFRRTLEESFLQDVRTEASQIVTAVYEEYDDDFQALFAEAEGVTGLETVATELQTHATLANTTASKNEAAIRLALVKTTDIDLRDIMLEEAIDYIRALHDIPIHIDDPAWEEVAIDREEPITLIVSDVTLESVLNQLLLPRELDWVIRDERILITTQRNADEWLTTSIYDVSDLLTEPGLLSFDDSGRRLTAEDLRDFVEMSLSDVIWESDGDIEPSLSTLNGMLSVTHSQRVHQRVANLIAQMRKTGQRRAARMSDNSQNDADGGQDSKPIIVTYRVAPALSNIPQAIYGGGFGASPSPEPPTSSKPDDDGKQQQSAELSERLAKTITEMIEPESWEDPSQNVMIRSFPGAIAVKHRPAVHAQIQRLLYPFRPLSDVRGPQNPQQHFGGGFGGGFGNGGGGLDGGGGGFF